MPEDKQTIGVAIIGCGTVGGATATLLTRDETILAQRVGVAIELRAIVDVDFTRARQLGLNEKLFTEDLDAVLADDRIDLVVELVGGTTRARDITCKALQAGKHVVTANKALLAHHGDALWATARENGVCIAFEASCGGGIPIVRALCDGLIANRIDALYGIVNGTCNHILTAMTLYGQSYTEALSEAQASGLAEADPTLDVGGGDSAHKLTILAALAFGRKVDLDAIEIEGINKLKLFDLQTGAELGYVVKLLAIAERQVDTDGQEGLSLSVRPAFISGGHPLAWVSGSFNAISVYGHATGHTMYYGRGAGGMPTASAVVADIVSVATGVAPRQFEQLRIWPDLSEPARQLPIAQASSRYYFRITCQDKPGVLAQIADVLGRHEVNITSVLQHEPQPDDQGGVPLVITTYSAFEGNVRNALAQIDELPDVQAKTVCLPIIHEYVEPIE